MDKINDRKQKKQEMILLTICMLGIFALLLWNIDRLNLIYIVGDEFGYWANAATFLGLDWSEIGANNPYYSFGWSLFLVPIMLITKNPSLMYKLAIGLNALFLAGVFLLIYCSTKKLFVNANKHLLMAVSLAVTLYSGNIFQSQTTQSEIALTFFYCLIFWSMIRWTEHAGILNSLILGLSSIFIYIIHMRCLAISIAVLMTVFVVSVYKKKIRQFLLILAVVIIIGLISFTIKDYLMGNLYINKVLAAINDFSGQSSKIRQLFSFNGVALFVINFIGKLYYLGGATFLLFFWSIYACIRRILTFFKEKDLCLLDVMCIFLLLSILGLISLGCISMLSVVRIDTLIYGRYYDVILGPVLLIGIMELMQNENRVRLLLAFLVFYLFSTFVVSCVVEYTGVNTLYPGNVPAIIGLGYNGVTMNYKYFEFVVFGKVVLISAAYTCLLQMQNLPHRTFLFCLSLTFLWLYLGFFVTETHVYKYQSNSSDYLIEEAVSGAGSSEEIYYVSIENGDGWLDLYIDYIQFLLPTTSIRQLDSAELESVSQNSFVIIANDEQNEVLINEFDRIVESNNFALYRRR